MKKSSVNEVVEYGLDSIDSNESVSVNLKDLLYIYKSIEELNRFFHQPLHYETIDELKQYFGNIDEGVYSIISNIYYKIFDRMLSPQIKEIVESDDFQHPSRFG